MKTVENFNSDMEKELIEARKIIASLREQLAWFSRQLFGKKSERKIVNDLNQLEFDFEGFSMEASVKEVGVVEHSTPSARRKPKRDGKDAIKVPPNLPVETVIIDIPEDQKVCKETGIPLVKIGEEVTHRLSFKPGSYFIKEIIRLKYASPARAENGIVCAELPGTIFPKCRADNSLLADILVKKFADHLPLYRISEILERESIEISRKLLSQWVGHCGRALTPLYDEMLKSVLSSGNIFVDESPINVQHAGGVEKGFMWVIVGGNEASPPYRIYNFAENRCHKHIFQILDTYKGCLHSDKYGAYVTLAKSKEKIIWNPCWTHIRRYFFEVESGDLEFCNMVLRKIRYLYMFERVAWNRSPEKRLEIRQKKEAPIIDDLIQKIKERVIKGNFLPKSKFSKALNYFMGLIPHLKNYTLYPFAHIDNNCAERAIRPLAIGRKNWLFFGSLDAGQSAAAVISLVQTCRGLGINPQEYLEDIFERLLDHNSSKLHELLPDQWLLNRQRN